MCILGWLNPLGPFIEAAERAHARILAAKNDSDRIAAEQDMAYWRNRVEAVQAAASNDKPWSPRSLMGYCVAIYIFKIIVWDSVLGWGVTAYPGEHVTFVVMTVIGFYFVSRGAETIASTIANAIARKHKL